MTHVLIEKPEDVKRLPVIFSSAEMREAVGHLVNSLQADRSDVNRYLLTASKKELQELRETIDTCLRTFL